MKHLTFGNAVIDIVAKDLAQINTITLQFYDEPHFSSLQQSLDC